MSIFTELKREAYEANLEIPKQQLAIYTFGNVSAFDKSRGVYAIKPSGVPYADLQMEDMVIVDLDNVVIEGSLNPSSDSKTHTVLYREFSEIGGICHTHSPYATAWAQAKCEIPILGTTHADHSVKSIPVTMELTASAINRDYEEATGKSITALFAEDLFAGLNFRENEMVLAACHGPFTWGVDAAKAVYNSRVLEELAKMAYLTLSINPEVSPLSKAIKEKHFFRKHGKNAYYGQK
ncbi:MAG: L-ribulose-5-phosphate 4-epimerase AraD [Bacteroidetes bacterium]|nr:L-ribulose-5-phosphate 4-epimerase AraD [Bacteroidota bacterium]